MFDGLADYRALSICFWTSFLSSDRKGGGNESVPMQKGAEGVWHFVFKSYGAAPTAHLQSYSY